MDDVLQQIQERYPKDYERLMIRVREIGPLSDDEKEEFNGLWEREAAPEAEVFLEERGYLDITTILHTSDDFWEFAQLFNNVKGVIRLPETGDYRDGVVAHELGHACTRCLDLRRRGKPGIWEQSYVQWRSELAADWHAYKWGFGRVIAHHRKNCNQWHHGPKPNQSVEFECNGQTIHYQVSHNFCVEPINPKL